jgi:hypothetical protein
VFRGPCPARQTSGQAQKNPPALHVARRRASVDAVIRLELASFGFSQFRHSDNAEHQIQAPGFNRWQIDTPSTEDLE